MRAMIIEDFGTADALRLSEIPKPVPGEGEVLVKIAAAGVNPADWKTRQGRLAEFIEYHFPFVLGFDHAGTIEAVGPGVEEWKPGDRVFGMSNQKDGKDGTYAEYCVSAGNMIAPLPEGWSFTDAAALPTAGTTAYGSLIHAGELKSGETLLINGGAGGVGSIAMQIARAHGARVAITCDPANNDYATALGAEFTIDYLTEDVVAAARKWAPEGIDFVLDAVGQDTLLPRAVELVKPGGRYVEIETLISRPTEEQVAHAAEHDVRVLSNMIAVTRQDEQLRSLAKLLADDHIRPPAIEVMPFEQVAEAHRRFERGHGRGRVVLDVQ